jgi:hypothetical protein
MAKKSEQNVGMLANRTTLQSMIAGLSDFASAQSAQKNKVDLVAARGNVQETNAQNRFSRTLSRDELIRQNKLNDYKAKDAIDDEDEKDKQDMKKEFEEFKNQFKRNKSGGRSAYRA